jgi:hypothetical protein
MELESGNGGGLEATSSLWVGIPIGDATTMSAYVTTAC